MSEPIEILLVEDNSEDAELTLRALRKNNLTNSIRHVTDGEQALEYLLQTSHRPKVVLLDLKLPKIHGLEVLQRLREKPATKSLPIVVLTSSQEDRDLARAYELGANSYVVKPVEFDAFVEAVSNLGIYWMLLNQAPES